MVSPASEIISVLSVSASGEPETRIVGYPEAKYRIVELSVNLLKHILLRLSVGNELSVQSTW